MKQKSGGIRRLMEFTGKHRGLLTVARILSGISSVFILGPFFMCIFCRPGFSWCVCWNRIKHSWPCGGGEYWPWFWN